MICDDCVFHKAIVERGQDVCALKDDPVAAIKACLEADYFSACLKKMNRDDVARLVKKNEQAERERDSARELLDVVQRVIAGMLREGDTDVAEV